MTIVFVADNFRHKTDGTTISTFRFREELVKRGHTVRVLGIGGGEMEGPDMYGLEEHWVPFVSWISRKNNMHFAKFDRNVVAKAFDGADMVHLIFPWQMERKCLKLAKEMGIPVTAAFHCQAENVTWNLHLKFFRFLNTFVYFLFRVWLYGKMTDIHCPSHFTERELRRHKYGARLHVISNGVLDCFRPAPEPESWQDGKFHIMMTGRLSTEKRQELAIKAADHSKYREKIQLHFVGRGPMYRRLLTLGAGLPNPPEFAVDYVPQEKLVLMLQRADLYVHTSDVELESLSCLEAIACGRVPVISDSGASAASQFALDSRSKFRHGDWRDLRDKIDWWIEHPEERDRMGPEYAKLGERYNIASSVDKLEKMFKDAAGKTSR